MFGEDTTTMIFLEIARVLFNKQQELQKAADQIGQDFDVTFNESNKAVWAKALVDKQIRARMNVLKTTIMKETFGSQWTKFAELGFTSPAELTEGHNIALSDWVCDKNKVLLRTFWQSAFPEKPPREENEKTKLQKECF